MDPTDPKLKTAEKPRLAGQCDRILQRLRDGPATNAELAHLSLKYTSRISDLRKHGYHVQIIMRNHHSGRTVYALRRDDGYFDESIIDDAVRLSAIYHTTCSSIRYWLVAEEGEPMLFTSMQVSPTPGVRERVATITKLWGPIEKTFTTTAQQERFREMRQAWDEYWSGFSALAGL